MGATISNEHNDDFLSQETERKVAEFEAKLKAEQAAMTDTSIRSSGMSINAPQPFYFDRGEKIPIYDTGLNKQIDRVDMEVDKARRNRNTIIADEVDQYMREIRAEIQAKQDAEAKGVALQPEEHHTAPFVFVVPIVVLVIGIILAVLSSMV